MSWLEILGLFFLGFSFAFGAASLWALLSDDEDWYP